MSSATVKGRVSMSAHVRLAAVALALLASAGCDDILDVTPPDQLPSDEAIVDAATARAALAGAYNALQSSAYYGGTMLFFNDLGADNAVHTGTLQTYADVDLHTVMPTNTSIGAIWSVIYEGINRTNIILEQVPDVDGMDAEERDQILGEAYMLRGLHHHNLVRHWGDVPIVTATVSSVEEASQVTRAPAADVYAQILSDLEQAESLMTDDDQTTRGSVGAAEALQARVHLYMGNWAQAEAKADEVLARDYTLADDFADLFEPDGAPTPEDVFRVIFTPQDYNNVGYYYLGNEFGGRGELAAELDLGPHLRLGKGELGAGGREKASILADATEAVIGAIFIDGGWEPARRLVGAQPRPGIAPEQAQRLVGIERVPGLVEVGLWHRAGVRLCGSAVN